MLFCADSDAVVEIVGSINGQLSDSRWRIAMCAIDTMLTDLGYDMPSRCRVISLARDAGQGQNVPASLHHQLGMKYREERRHLEALFQHLSDGTSELAPQMASLSRRSNRLAPISQQLRSHIEAGQLTAPLDDLTRIYLHMHINRLFQASQRTHEGVLYDFLARYYESQLARVKRHEPSRAS
jgi:thiopeptide-type bacteriocin biosynthesis protein